MSEFKVGLLALATIIVVAVMSLKITSNQSGFGEFGHRLLEKKQILMSFKRLF